jgi:hypothetical protein
VAGERPRVKAARELEKIAKDLDHLATGYYRLRVEMEEKKQAISEDQEDSGA